MKKLLVMAAVAAMLMGTGQARAGEAWDFTSSGTSYSNGNWDFGAAFYVNNTVTVSGLGYYADPVTGFVASNPVALYQCVGGGANCIGSTGNLLTSATVTNAYPEFGHFRFVTVAPVVLTPGWYEVAGESNVQNYTWNDPGFATDPNITYYPNSDLWQSGGGDGFLNYVPTEQEIDGFWGPNVFFGQATFTQVPEPATMAIFSAGLVMMAAARRRRRG